MKKATQEINEAAAQAVQVITDAAGAATKSIAQAALEATKLLALNASEAAKVTNSKGADDHDSITTLIGSVANLSLRLGEKFDELKADIKDLKDGTAAKISDHEVRITANSLQISTTQTQLKTWGSVFGVAVVAMQVLFHFWK